MPPWERKAVGPMTKWYTITISCCFYPKRKAEILEDDVLDTTDKVKKIKAIKNGKKCTEETF